MSATSQVTRHQVEDVVQTMYIPISAPLLKYCTEKEARAFLMQWKRYQLEATTNKRKVVPMCGCIVESCQQYIKFSISGGDKMLEEDGEKDMLAYIEGLAKIKDRPTASKKLTDIKPNRSIEDPVERNIVHLTEFLEAKNLISDKAELTPGKVAKLYLKKVWPYTLRALVKDDFKDVKEPELKAVAERVQSYCVLVDRIYKIKKHNEDSDDSDEEAEADPSSSKKKPKKPKKPKKEEDASAEGGKPKISIQFHNGKKYRQQWIAPAKFKTMTPCEKCSRKHLEEECPKPID